MVVRFVATTRVVVVVRVFGMMPDSSCDQPRLQRQCLAYVPRKPLQKALTSAVESELETRDEDAEQVFGYVTAAKAEVSDYIGLLSGKTCLREWRAVRRAVEGE